MFRKFLKNTTYKFDLKILNFAFWWPALGIRLATNQMSLLRLKLTYLSLSTRKSQMMDVQIDQ